MVQNFGSNYFQICCKNKWNWKPESKMVDFQNRIALRFYEISNDSNIGDYHSKLVVFRYDTCFSVEGLTEV